MTPKKVSFFTTLFLLFSWMVPRSLHPFFTFLGNPLVFLILKRYREAVKENLRTVGQGAYSEKELTQLAKRCFYHYSIKLLDYMSMQRVNLGNRTKWIEQEIGEEHLKEALMKGKGVICVTPHFGNWELGGYILAQKGYPIHILTLKEESQFLSRYEKRLRQKAGIHAILIDPEEKPNLALLEVIKALKKNEIIAMVSDRIYNDQGMGITFFGRQTLFPVGPIYLALETGATVIPVFVILNKKMKYCGIIDEPIPIRTDLGKDEALREGLQEMAKRFEKVIRRYPDQWLNFFPFWEKKGK